MQGMADIAIQSRALGIHLLFIGLDAALQDLAFLQMTGDHRLRFHLVLGTGSRDILGDPGLQAGILAG